MTDHADTCPGCGRPVAECQAEDVDESFPVTDHADTIRPEPEHLTIPGLRAENDKLLAELRPALPRHTTKHGVAQMNGLPTTKSSGTPIAASMRVNVPIHLVLLKALADAPREWVDDADLFVKYTSWLSSIGGNRV